jgi:hypothetical protein
MGYLVGKNLLRMRRAQSLTQVKTEKSDVSHHLCTNLIRN